MTGHRALEKKQITQGNNRKVQNPSGLPKRKRVTKVTLFFCFDDISFITRHKATD